MKLIKVIAVVALVIITGGLVLGTACGTDTTPPSLPSSLTRTTPGNDNTPSFSWDAANDDSGVDHYLVSVDGGEWMDVGDVTSYALNTPLSDGSHTLKVKAVDKAGNEGNEGTLTFTCDTKAPIISSVSAASTSSSSATTTWTTDEDAMSQVEYSATASYGSLSVLDTNLVATHTVNLTGLTANTIYHYRVKSPDAAGNDAVSGDYSFATPQPVTGVTLNKSSTAIVKGLSEKLVVTILPSDATNQDVTWSSTDDSIASVSSSGLVTAVGIGTAVITVTTVDQGLKANCTVTVTKDGQLPTLKVGDKWTYEMSLQGSYYSVTYEVTGEGYVNGEGCWIVQRSYTPALAGTDVSNVTERWSKVTFHTLQMQVSTTIGGTPVSWAWVYSYTTGMLFPMEVGKQYDITQTTVLTTTTAGTPTESTTTTTLTYKVETVEEITVQAGTFRCFKITIESNGSTSTAWYSDKVKNWVKTIDADGSTMELKSYSV